MKAHMQCVAKGLERSFPLPPSHNLPTCNNTRAAFPKPLGFQLGSRTPLFFKGMNFNLWVWTNTSPYDTKAIALDASGCAERRSQASPRRLKRCCPNWLPAARDPPAGPKSKDLNLAVPLHHSYPHSLWEEAGKALETRMQIQVGFLKLSAHSAPSPRFFVTIYQGALSEPLRAGPPGA